MTSKSKVNGKEVKGEYLFREPYAHTLRKWRVHRGFSQQTLAKEARLPTRVIGGLERCERPIDLKEIVKLCHALKVHPRRFMDEAHGLLQRTIQSLDEGMREVKAEQGMEELPAKDQEARKAVEFLAEKALQLITMIDSMSNLDWSPPVDEPQGSRGGGKRVRPSRKPRT